MKDLLGDNRIPLGIGAAALVAVAGFAVFGNSDSDDSGQVKVACRDWVKDRLKSPSSADFSRETVTRDGKTYVVTGAVDSENSFGAKVRNNYRCEATRDGDSSSLVSISGLDG